MVIDLWIRKFDNQVWIFSAYAIAPCSTRWPVAVVPVKSVPAAAARPVGMELAVHGHRYVDTTPVDPRTSRGSSTTWPNFDNASRSRRDSGNRYPYYLMDAGFDATSRAFRHHAEPNLPACHTSIDLPPLVLTEKPLITRRIAALALLQVRCFEGASLPIDSSRCGRFPVALRHFARHSQPIANPSHGRIGVPVAFFAPIVWSHPQFI